MCAQITVRRPSRRFPHVLWALGALLGGCTLAPEGTDAEFARLQAAGGEWAVPSTRRVLPELPAAPGREDVVARALLANADLEAAWHEWRAALEAVLVASGWPNTDLAIGLTTFISNGGAWDTTAVSVGFDPMQMLLLPAKVRQAGEVAFEQALAAGRRFEAERLALRAEALSTWLAWWAAGERVGVLERDVALIESLERQAHATVGTGGSQGQLLERQLEVAAARNALAVARAEWEAGRAQLNALLLREPDEVLEPPAVAPVPRARPSDAELIRIGVAANPDLAALEHEALARQQAAELAELDWFPDVAPSAQVGGGIEESLGLGFTFPTTLPAVKAAIREARALADAAGARFRQGRLDLRAELLAALAALRAQEQVLSVLQQWIEPSGRSLEANARQSYITGSGGLPELVATQRALLELRAFAAETLARRESRLADVERLVGVDLSRLGPTTPAIADATEEQP